MLLFVSAHAQQKISFKIGKLKYDGGGDWYANPSSLPNLFDYIRKNTRANIYLEEEVVEPGSPAIYQYPMLYITGHGNIVFSDAEVKNLRKYLLSGGFLLADDNYGLQPYIKREIKKIFPEYELQEIPYQHPIYHCHYSFPKGIPKIHEHDGKPAQAFGIFHENRLVLMLTYECDLGDGWEDAEVHNDSPQVRELAFRMGTNIVLYILQN
ncbi:MAG: DUF4159 domain-containing protein [Bacteroidia bacterium]|nr:DUF4159 domain-containing protein [Bacteroidia bacterium]